MSACPEIDVLLSATARDAARLHLDGCAACAAVAALAEVRQERLDCRDDECMLAEVRIAAWPGGALDSDEQVELMAHLERCGACNEVAARARAMATLSTEGTEVRPASASGGRAGWRSSAPRWGGAVAMAAAVGVLVGWALRGPAVDQQVAAAPEPTSLPVGGGSKAVSRPASAGQSSAEPVSPESSAAPAATRLAGPVGYVTLMCEPGCEVYEGGQRLGASPLVRHAASVGVHRYTLVDGAFRRSITLSVTEGSTSVRRIGMSAAEHGLVDPWGADPPPKAAQPAPSSEAAQESELENPFAAGPVGALGYLTVVCTPGCDEVSVDGKSLGASPVLRAPVAPGARHLTLKRGPVVKVRTVSVAGGKTLAVRVDMTASPPSPPKKDAIVNPWR